MIYWDNVIRFIGILFVWGLVTVCIPSLCLRPFMGKMRLSERILFYQIISVVYCNFVSLALGFLHIYNTFTILLAYGGIPLGIRAYCQRSRIREWMQKLSSVLSDLTQGRYGFRLFFHHIRQRLETGIQKLKDKMKEKGVVEVFGLLLLLVCLAAYFGEYKFTHYGYAAPDEEVHLYWIQSLIHNDIFPAGMYPHSMHSILALLCTLIPMEEVRVVLNFSTTIVILNMLALHILLRKVQRNSWTALASGFFFCVSGLFAVDAYSRFQFTIPMEFGMVGIPAMIIALLNLLKEGKRRDMVLFMCTVAYTISSHFYIAILAVVVLIGFGIVYIVSFCKKKLLRHVLLWGVIGVVVSCIPFGIGYIIGYPFEQSMEWSMGIIAGSSNEAIILDKDEMGDVIYLIDNEGNMEIGYKEGLTEEQKLIAERRFRFNLWKKGIENGVIAGFNNEMGTFLVLVATGIALIYTIIGCIFCCKKRAFYKFGFASVVVFILAIFVMCLPKMGLPEIIDDNRVKVFLYLWHTVIIFLLLEMLAGICRNKVGKRVMVLIGLTGGFVLLVITDNQERNKYIHCVNQEDAMYACLEIMEHCEDEHYTVVSTTNELSVVRYHGYHVEWIDFLAEQMNAKTGDVYTIPTEDVYFIIEKRMLNYGAEDYEEDGWGTEMLNRVGKAYAGMEIREEFLDKDIANRNKVYSLQRSVIMSKAYYWALEYQKYYNLEFSNVFETENLVVFHLKQNPYALNNLLLSEGVY